MEMCCICLADDTVDIVHNPCTDLFRAIFRTTFDLNLRCAHVLVKGSIDSLAHECALLLQSEVLKEHGNGKNLCKRIGDVQPLSLW